MGTDSNLYFLGSEDWNCEMKNGGRTLSKIRSGRIGSSTATFQGCGLRIGQEIAVDNPWAGSWALETEIRKQISGYSCGWCTISWIVPCLRRHTKYTLVEVPPMQTAGMTSWSSWRRRQVHHLRLRTREVDPILDCPRLFGISVSKESHHNIETEMRENDHTFWRWQSNYRS